MTKVKKITYEELVQKLDYLTEDDLNLIKKCYDYASLICFDKGDDAISRPLNVVNILVDTQPDSATICATILHSIVEKDNSLDISEFGKEIVSLVEGVEKIKKLNFDLSTESSIASQRKILVGLTNDFRVISIRLAERLYEMRNLWNMPKEEQKQMALETVQILTPIAHRLGMSKIKSELEDLALRYYKPDVYFDIVNKLNQTKQERDNAVNEMIEAVSNLLDENSIEHQIKGRSKSIYSIYKKLSKGKKFSEIYDLLAMRVFVNTKAECYQVLGIIHSKFKPMAKRFKDYIAMPKTNMYQSLHTTVFGIDGHLYEIQIRTYEMDKIAEQGIASHWSYKEQGSNKIVAQDAMDEKLQFFRSLMELNNEDTTDVDFLSAIREEFNDTIYVYTPLGDVIELPAGSTPIDFAYKVHSGVGDKMVGALVNDVLVPLDYELKNEDVVKINTSNSSNGPNLEWVNIAKTMQAKNKIKAFFRKADKEESIKKGEELLNKELHKIKISNSDFYKDENIEKLKKNFKCDLNEIYKMIGNSKITPTSVIEIIYKEKEEKEDTLLKKVMAKNNHAIKKDIEVSGINDIKVKLASCCTPVPGDEIVGYITKGYGITVHRMDCPNLALLDQRLIDVSWSEISDKKYSAGLVIQTEKKDNVLLEIVSKASNNSINIESINTNSNLENITYELVILVDNLEKLNKFITAISNISDVIFVERKLS